jgi:transcriptional regulator with XRE-family HTH domain
MDEAEKRKRAVGARWLEIQMEKLGIIQIELARRSGLSTSTIGNIRHLRKGVGADTARKLARGLGVTQDDAFLAFGLKTEMTEVGGKPLDPLSQTGLRELMAMPAHLREHAVHYLMSLNKTFPGDEPPPANGQGAERRKSRTAPLA